MKSKNNSTIVIRSRRRYSIKTKLIVAISLFTIAAVLFRHIMVVKKCNEQFSKQASEFYKLNAQTVFSIDKIYMYSSANAIENKENRPVWNFNLYQYTDIAIYINNRSEDKLTYENSIKSLYIDNIKFTDVKKGTPSLYYKNINDFGKSIYIKAIEDNTSAVAKQQEIAPQPQNTEEIENSTAEESVTENQNNQQEEQQPEDLITIRKQIVQKAQEEKITDKLEFAILNDGDVDYTKPQLYTDCSNPITLEYVNDNIRENQIISDIKNDIIYDGNILRRSGVVLNEITCTMSFNINLINYYNQKFIANVYIDIPLEDTNTGDNIYKGKFIKVLENTDSIRFFRME